MKSIVGIISGLAILLLAGCSPDYEKAEPVRGKNEKISHFLITEIEGCRIYHIGYNKGVYFAKCGNRVQQVMTWAEYPNGKNSPVHHPTMTVSDETD